MFSEELKNKKRKVNDSILFEDESMQKKKKLNEKRKTKNEKPLIKLFLLKSKCSTFLQDTNFFIANSKILGQNKWHIISLQNLPPKVMIILNNYEKHNEILENWKAYLKGILKSYKFLENKGKRKAIPIIPLKKYKETTLNMALELFKKKFP
jgi:hypothetical protein